jgi:hypothetical protein
MMEFPEEIEFRAEPRRYKYWLARMFGKPIYNKGEVVAYVWRKCWYMMPKVCAKTFERNAQKGPSDE